MGRSFGASSEPEVRATVSVVIPTRDRGDLLARALSSVAAQTRPADEVLVVDDGSADDIAAVVGGFSGVRCERIPPSGVSAARNHGIRTTAGEWLAFLDSDDAWLPAKLESQLAALAAEPGHLVCHSGEIWIRNGRRVHPRRRHRKYGGWMFRHCLPLCAISPSSVLIHRRVLDRVGLFDESLPACEDYDLWLRICARYPVLLVDQPLIVKYGGHADQLSRTVEALDRFRIRALEKILDDGVLGDEDRQAAVEMLLSKVEIYRQGAVRRDRCDEVADLDSLIERFLREP